MELMLTVRNEMIRRGYVEAARELHLRWREYRTAEQAAIAKAWRV